MKKFLSCIVMMLTLWAGTLSADEIVEPTDIVGGVFATAAATGTNPDCWVPIFNYERFSTDDYKDLYFELELDSCSVIAYETYSILQSTELTDIEPQDLVVDDLFCVWDEDSDENGGHGHQTTTWSFTGTYEAVILDDSDNCDYARVVTNDTNSILNWAVYRVISPGTFTVLSTGTNEHDTIHLLYNYINIENYDDVEDGECISPSDSVNYTVCLGNDTDTTYEDVVATIYLDEGVTYEGGTWQIDSNFNITPPDPWYNEEERSYVWELGTLYPDDYVCVDIEVTVNESAIPGMQLVNIAEATANICYDLPIDDPNDPNAYETICDTKLIARLVEYTDVCCWGDTPDIIYVDASATSGSDNGVDWDNAYCGSDGLAKALFRAEKSSCSGSYDYKIYVAAGTYYPGTDEKSSFTLLDNMTIYGGFPKGGCDFADRNPKAYQPILSGQVDDDSTPDIASVVTMANDSLLDGVKVVKGLNYNIYGEGVDFTVKNCEINKSRQHGIYALAGDVTIKSCKIYSNKSDGIYHEGDGFALNVYNSWIMRSGRYGLYTLSSTLNSYNNIISENDMNEQGSDGIFMVNPSSSPSIINCTISNNKAAGVFYASSGTTEDPNDYPTIANCIIYFNNGGSDQLNGINPDEFASYCCIQNCTEVNNNFNDDPLFAYPVDDDGTPDPNNYHILYSSSCVNSGDPYLDYSDQTDYDNESRIADDDKDRVDVGADEVYSCSGDYTDEDISNQLDFNADGLVNIKEFQFIADAWLTHDEYDPAWISDPNLADPNSTVNWNPDYNLDETGDSQYTIDIDDLEVFLSEYWLWQACWYESSLTLEATTEATTASTASVSLLSANASKMSTMATTASTLSYVEDTAEEEISPYSGLSNSQIAELVQGIYDLEGIVQEQIDSGSEDSEDLTEILDFFDDILLEIQDYLIETEE